jgi:3-hydroxyisobutyrate dehydrogenase
MGEPMARNLARSNLLHAVWNRTEARAAAVAADYGLILASSPADLAAQVDVVLLCVSADRDVLEIVENLLPAIRPYTVVVDHSTVSPETSCQSASLIRARGGDFLDAPVTGGVEGARSASLVIMVGGRPATLAGVTPVLKTLSRRIVSMGDVGCGQAAKAVNQAMAAGINQAVTEALAFGQALGLDMHKVIDVVAGGAAGNWFLDKRGDTMIDGRFGPGFKVALHHKDLQICEQMASELGMTLPLVRQTVADYARLMAEGHGDEDISALYRLKKPKA